MIIFDVLKEYENQKVDLYVDMDGVIADYEVGVAENFDKKRPLLTNISKLKEISKMPNVNLHILSVTRMSIGTEEKNKWLDIYAPFFEHEKRNILSREKYNFEKTSIDLKYEFMIELDKSNSQIIFIDDDPAILHKIKNNIEGVLLLKDTTLVD